MQGSDDLTLTRGSTGLLFGARFGSSPAYEQQELNLNGRFDYDSLSDLLNGNPRRFQQTFATGNTVYGGTINELDLYGNVQTALRHNVFLTAGLRWAGQWNPQPAAPGASLPVTQRIPDDLKQWQPRVGLAWDVSPKTIVRASAGLFAAPTPATFFHRVSSDNGAQTVTADSYFDPLLLQLTGCYDGVAARACGCSARFVDAARAGSGDRRAVPEPAFVRNVAERGRTRVAETCSDGRLSAHRRVAAGATAGREPRTAGCGVGHGYPLFASVRPIAGVGRLLVEQATSHSSYNGGFASVVAPFSRRTTLLANYTFRARGMITRAMAHTAP